MATESKPIQLHTDCPDFKLKGVDHKNHSLSDYQNSKILVVAFTCNHCPYVQAYEGRLNQLAKEYQGKGVSFVCINANDDRSHPDDSFEKMQERAERLEFAFDYLRDADQTTAKKFNAACTPEFYVYDSTRKLEYHGRLDDNQNANAVSKTYLKDAIEDLLAMKSPRLAQTSAIGCSIKWK